MKTLENALGAVSLLLLSVFAPAWAESGAGTTAVPFLTMGVGARALAMGEAATATTDDATALFWNPAGLAQLEGQSATFMHAAALEDSSLDYAAYARHKGPSAWGIGVQYFSAGDIETSLDGQTFGTYTPNDLAATLGYATTWGGYGIGLSAKYIQSNLVETARTYALDAGVLSPAFWKDRVRAGIALANLGGGIKYDQESSDLPMTLRAGLAVYPAKGWTGALDVVSPKGDDPYGALGTEYRLGLGTDLSLSLRAGYTTKSTGGQDQGFSAGMGFGWRKLTVDYAFVNQPNFDASQVLSVGYAF
jgi:hypothetical protein